jgi:hypothetical protein
LLFIEDFLQSPAPQSPAPPNPVSDHYQATGTTYKNSGAVSVSPGPAAQPKLPPPRNYGPGVVVHDKGSSYKNEKANGVEYTPLSERVLKYKVFLAGHMTRGAPPELFDTPGAKQQAVQRYGDGQIGNATLEQEASQNALAEEWAKKALIWVCVPIDANDVKQSVFYSHVCRPGAFHHSSLAIGREVYGAGEWIVEGGKLKKISANSGHYQPSLSSLHQSVLAMAPAWQPDTTVFLWNKTTKLWEDVPVNSFAKDAGGGKYKSHPRAGA